MKILFIAPASGKWQKVAGSKLFNGRTFRFSMLSLLTVAAETPPDAEVQIVDEQIDDIPWDVDVDLVCITCMTAVAPRAYEIASRFLSKGIPVVLGGMHPTLCPEEAILHATAIVVGEAEGIWPRVVYDALNSKLKGIYRNKTPHPLKGLKRPPQNLLDIDRYATVHAIQATRGCPHGCDFCSVSVFSGKTQRQRPVNEVIDEVKRIPDRFVMFVDDNLTANQDYARRLFNALKPLNKYWVSQATLGIADDPEFVHLIADSGCIGLFVGLETFSEKNLNDVNKSCHRVEQYQNAIQLLHSYGIGIEAGIVFGFDGDTPEVFSNTLDIIDRLEIDEIQVSVFTPLPGTPAFKRMKDRIFDKDWTHYDFHNVVFQPKRMSVEQLKAGHDWVTHQFYRPWRIARRVWRHAKRPKGMSTIFYHLALNMAYYGRVTRWGIRGYDPDTRTNSTSNKAPIAVLIKSKNQEAAYRLESTVFKSSGSKIVANNKKEVLADAITS